MFFKQVFAAFVASKQLVQGVDSTCWKCCNQMFDKSLDVYKHISHQHTEELEEQIQQALKVRHLNRACSGDEKGNVLPAAEYHDENDQVHTLLSGGDVVASLDRSNAGKKQHFGPDDVFPWLPAVLEGDDNDEIKGQVLLFYRYTVLEDPDDICRWQEELCRRLQLSGKV